jgi:hypothetical protein
VTRRDDDPRRRHAPRTLRAGGEREPRPSLADEDWLTADVRTQERIERAAAIAGVLRHLAVAERELRAARAELPTIDRATRRDLDRVRQAIARVRERHQ